MSHRPLLALCLALPALACRAGTGGLPAVDAAQLAALLASAAPPLVFDANSDDTRDEYGVIPGARLLSSYRDYALDELPPDKGRSLVFYCHSAMCGAARDAALKAHEAGYTQVSVLPEGIRGWVDEGRPVARPDA